MPSPKSALPTSKADRPRRGVAVLRSPAARALVSAWAIGLVLYFVPGPYGAILRRRPDPAARRASSTPIPGVASAPARSQVAGERVTTATARSASPERPGVPPRRFSGQAIEDPAGSLRHFARALSQTERETPVRVLHYGDSQLDLDHISGSLRRRYQARYGDGGFGYTPAVKPWRWFYQRGVVHQASAGWTLHRLATRRLQDGRLGIGLSAAERRDAGWVRVVMRHAAARVELSYLAQPGGGSAWIYIKGKKPRRVRTGSRSGYRAGFVSVALPAHKKQQIVHVATTGRVRLFGLAFERRGGLTWENLPMISARFHRLAELSGALWKQQLAHRAPALVVFQFGANDTISYGGDIQRYGAAIERVLAWRAEAVPRGGCLILGPLDQLVRSARGKLVVRPTLTRVLAAQRRAALAQACAFWDSQAAMGGPGSLMRWIARGLLRKDQVHLSNKGAAELARLLDEALEHALGTHRRAGKDRAGKGR